MSKKSKEIKEVLREKKPVVETREYLSSGSTLVNLAIRGRPDSAWSKGCYYLLVGDSASGKTFLALQTLAEATLNKDFSSYSLIYDAPEQGARMDLEKFFGPRLKQQLIVTASPNVEGFYYYLDTQLKSGPCIYVLDSMDALRPEADLEMFDKNKVAHEKGKERSESYGTAKARGNSANLGVVTSNLHKTGSILFIISQTRDNIGWNSQFTPKIRSGGNALKFYASIEVWFSVRERIKRTIKGKPRQVGSVLRAQVKKNRETGWEPTVDLIHYPSVGFDDVGAMISFLVDEKIWQEDRGKIVVPDWDVLMGEEDLVLYIEEADLTEEIKNITYKTWKEIEEACSVKRRSRYV